MSTHPISLLLVEDNPGDARLVFELMRGVPDLSIHLADRLSTAIERLSAERDDVVLLDLGLPDSQGLSTLRTFVQAGCAAPIVVLTGLDDDAMGQTAIQEGAQDFLAKSRITATDLTRAVRHAIERNDAQARLKASKEYLANVINAIGDPVFVKNERSQLSLVNDAYCAFVGRTRDELLGSTGTEFLPESQMQGFLEVDRNVLASGQEDLREEQLTDHAGTIRTILTRKTRYVDARGARSLVGVIRDISRHKHAEDERAKLEAQLRASQKMEAIGSLAGGVAHDFNNLLAVILSYTEFAMEALREGDPLRADLQEVKLAADRAAALTRQLLAFGRKQVLQPVPLSLNDVAAGVEQMLRRILGEDIELALALAPDLGVARADPGQLEQVLMNLVVNARDAMPDGGKLTIETANVELDPEYTASHLPMKPGPYVRLAVTDTGSGMDAQTHARLFEPFFTTKEKGKGTGLGLSTVYGIVKQSEGYIWAYSELGQGTTFTICLPRELSVTAVVPRPPMARRPSRGTETILVVEDEEALRKVARRSLEAAGYHVLVAAAGDEALQLSARHPGTIHLLLTDVVMPRMSGKDLARELLKTRPALTTLFTSGYSDAAIVHHGVLDAGTHFIGKPFTATDLTRKVREVLDGRTREPPEEDATRGR